MVILVILFWLCLAILAWEIILFPALLALAALLFARKTKIADITPSVSVVISVHNEEKSIAEKLEDILAQDYPRDKCEIIVVDDCSNDSSAEIVEGFAARGVKLIKQDSWKGKTAAQNLAVDHAANEIILFSDATAIYNPGAICAMMRNFADEKVGCVTGQVLLDENIADNTTVEGAKSRLAYEQKVRAAQGKAFSLFGATGCIYMVRKSLYVPVAEDQVSDLVLPLMLLEKGYKTVYEPAAVATLARPVSAEREFERRSRIILQCMRAMFHMKQLLNPTRVGITIAALAWYRLLRWLLPPILDTLLILNIILAIYLGNIYTWLLVGQILFYLAALTGGISELMKKKLPLVGIPFYFLWINVAAGTALLRLIAGDKALVWNTKR